MQKTDVWAEEFHGLPVLIALARRPMLTSEISLVLGLSYTAVMKRLRELETLGYVIRRYQDGRWVMRVVLRAEPLPEASHVPGVDGPGEVFLVPQKLVGSAQMPANATVAVPPSPKGSTGQLGPSDSPSGKQAEMLRVPAHLEGAGELSIGTGARCTVCGRATPVKYGGSAICPKCARAWRGPDANSK